MFITIVTKCYYTCDLYYICDQLLHLCLQHRSLARSLAACFDHLFKKRVFLGGRIIIRFPFIYRLRQSTMKRNRHEAQRKGEENQLTPVVLC